jgi:D-sedoheptulose 7-phosphate isomerase
VDGEVSHQRAIETIWDEHLLVATALRSLAPAVDQVVAVMARSMAAGGVLLVCGNGGSAADAQHIAAELTGRFFRDRKPLPALALHGNTSSLTAIGNDYGYDEVFAREVGAHGRTGDVLLAISTSGNSRNIVRAIEAAREKRMAVIGLTGESGGKMRDLCDVCLCVPSTSTPRIQECHILIGHTICELLEQILC